MILRKRQHAAEEALHWPRQLLNEHFMGQIVGLSEKIQVTYQTVGAVHWAPPPTIEASTRWFGRDCL